MEKLFVIKYGDGSIYGNKCFIHKEDAKYCITYERDNTYKSLYLAEIEVPFAKRSVCYLYCYDGFDYDYSNSSIYNVIRRSDIYACSDEAKQDPMWKSAMQAYENSPEDFIINDYQISSKSNFDNSEFLYGDVMEDKFNLKIKRLKVVRSI